MLRALFRPSSLQSQGIHSDHTEHQDWNGRLRLYLTHSLSLYPKKKTAWGWHRVCVLQRPAAICTRYGRMRQDEKFISNSFHVNQYIILPFLQHKFAYREKHLREKRQLLIHNFCDDSFKRSPFDAQLCLSPSRIDLRGVIFGSGKLVRDAGIVLLQDIHHILPGIRTTRNQVPGARFDFWLQR